METCHFLYVSGQTLLDRFANDWQEIVKFHTKGQIFRIQNDPITMHDWVHERDYYTRIQLMTKYFSSRKYIFVMECKKLQVESANKQEFLVVVSLFSQLSAMIM